MFLKSRIKFAYTFLFLSKNLFHLVDNTSLRQRLKYEHTSNINNTELNNTEKNENKILG